MLAFFLSRKDFADLRYFFSAAPSTVQVTAYPGKQN